MEIITKRLTLRPIQMGDEKAIHEYAGDKSLTMMFFLPNDTFEETAAFVKENSEEWNSEDQTNFEFVILLDGRIIGGCDCDLGHSADRSYATLGWIISRNYRNHGYASEAASAILDFAFENLKTDKVYAQCDINNPASFGVMRKIGMKCISDKGTRTYPKTGETSGEYTCMITRIEWEKQNKCKMNQNELISCCGSDCGSCYCFGNMCRGCNALSGKVFHVPEGKACSIYDCCRNQNGLYSCGECEKLPCDLILGTRDPSLSEEEFMKTVNDRVKRLKG